MEKALLILESGKIYEGEMFGHISDSPIKAISEVVFNTSMTGYQEIVTDPSYFQQMICFTYPLIGNYGVNEEDFESNKISVDAVIVREHCESPSNWRNKKTFEAYLKENKIVGLCNIDTRDLVKNLRDFGVMRAAICSLDVDKTQVIRQLKGTTLNGHVAKLSTKKIKSFGEGETKIALLDFGVKKSIIESLVNSGLTVYQCPYDISFEEIQKLGVDGVLLSNGPGDPREVEILDTIKKIQNFYPTMGICLGHQLLCLSNGMEVEKMKFGNRGANHPVKDLYSGKVFLTSQNHGYVVKEKLNDELEVTHVNINDKSIEGVRHKNKPVFSVQFHPEANPGPKEAKYLFETFLKILKDAKGKNQHEENSSNW